jgi:hypothetical protein
MLLPGLTDGGMKRKAREQRLRKRELFRDRRLVRGAIGG